MQINPGLSMSILDRARALVWPGPQPEHGEEARAAPRAQLALALQGGGSFGAFAWGVLDRLLQDERVDIGPISGASAGAVNGVLVASGLVTGGREGARERLATFWNRMVDEASFFSLATLPGFGSAPALVARSLSPAQLNPFDLNPLRHALAQDVDFDALRDPRAPRLLIAATRVHDGALRLFRNEDVSLDAVLASACLPSVNKAVEIDGEAYWDGAFAANPPLLPLVHEHDVRDLLLVLITPSKDARMPVTKTDITHRLDQITFNSPLNAELAALELARRIGASPKSDALQIHRIAAEDEVDGLAARSGADLGRSFVGTLHQRGREAADRWLKDRT